MVHGLLCPALFQRRDFLVLAGASLLPGALRAQEFDTSDAEFLLRLSFERADIVASASLEGSFSLVGVEGAFQELADMAALDLSSRAATQSALADLLPFERGDVEAALAYAADIPVIFPDFSEVSRTDMGVQPQLDTIRVLARRGAPVYLSERAVVSTLMNPPAVPMEDSEALWMAGDEIGVEPLRIVLVDILLETFGIVVGRQAILTILSQSSEEFDAALDDLTAAVTTKDWEEVFAIVQGVFSLMIGLSWFSRFYAQAGRKVSLRLVLACVPIVGWVYLAAAFVVAVKAHHHRLPLNL